MSIGSRLLGFCSLCGKPTTHLEGHLSILPWISLASYLEPSILFCWRLPFDHSLGMTRQGEMVGDGEIRIEYLEPVIVELFPIVKDYYLRDSKLAYLYMRFLAFF